jgi:hypothetical protein
MVQLTDFQLLSQGIQVPSENRILHIGYSANTQLRFAQYSNDLNFSIPAFSTTLKRLISAHLNTSSGRSLYLNSSLVASSSNTTALFNSYGGVIGMSYDGTGKYNGTIFEILIYPTSKLSNRVDLETDILDYYGID